MQLEKGKTRDFYGLLNYKIHTVSHAGPMKWNNTMRLDEDARKNIFTSLKNIWKETKLKEFQFKLIRRIIPKRSFIDMVLKRMMNVSTVVSKTQLIIHLLTVNL
jgi:hypothetical protein